MSCAGIYYFRVLIKLVNVNTTLFVQEVQKHLR